MTRDNVSGFLPFHCGNVTDSGLRSIYRDSPALREMRRPADFGGRCGRCGRCEFREVCGGSRSHGYAVTGDHLAEDPTCSYQPA
ncbi:hypothetical protein [Enemella dayhoffiae]|uniref:hypothetical protein n=1 Tax=Enemella dayhoffiae TaxID=2016507 RepID=UPI001E308824|nr:hypothetical protein [Enemella dayhoffiae]